MNKKEAGRKSASLSTLNPLHVSLDACKTKVQVGVSCCFHCYWDGTLTIFDTI